MLRAVPNPAAPSDSHLREPDRPRPLLLRLSEAAEVLGLSVATVKRLVTTGALPSVSVGTARRVLYSDLEEFVERIKAGDLLLDAKLHPAVR